MKKGGVRIKQTVRRTVSPQEILNRSTSRWNETRLELYSQLLLPIRGIIHKRSRNQTITEHEEDDMFTNLQDIMERLIRESGTLCGYQLDEDYIEIHHPLSKLQIRYSHALFKVSLLNGLLSEPNLNEDLRVRIPKLYREAAVVLVRL